MLPVFVRHVTGQYISLSTFDSISQDVLAQCGFKQHSFDHSRLRSAVERLFACVDHNGSQAVEWRAALLAFVALSKGNTLTKLRVAMASFDEVGHQALHQHQVFALLQLLSPEVPDTQLLCRAVSSAACGHTQCKWQVDEASQTCGGFGGGAVPINT